MGRLFGSDKIYRSEIVPRFVMKIAIKKQKEVGLGATSFVYYSG